MFSKIGLPEIVKKLRRGKDVTADLAELNSENHGVPFDYEQGEQSPEIYLMNYLNRLLGGTQGLISLYPEEGKTVYIDLLEKVPWLLERQESEHIEHPFMGCDFWQENFNDWCQKKLGVNSQEVDWEAQIATSS